MQSGKRPIVYAKRATRKKSIVYCIKGKNHICIISSDCHKIRPHVKNIKDEIYKYPLYNTSGNPFILSFKPHKHQYHKKVIISNSGKLSPFYDAGKYGTTQDSVQILVTDDKEGNQLVEMLNSSLYTFLVKICSWGNFRNESSLFSYLKYPIIDKITDNNIYDYFMFSQNEIAIIN